MGNQRCADLSTVMKNTHSHRIFANLWYNRVPGLAVKYTSRPETFENLRKTEVHTARSATKSPITTDSFGISTDGVGNGEGMELCDSLWKRFKKADRSACYM